MSNELIIDVNSKEVAIALLRNKELVELNNEKNNIQFTVGDIYLANVKKIMPSLNAAFVDVGYEKDAFLHYLDLGPQFQSLNKYLEFSLSPKNYSYDLSKFKPLPDIDKGGKIKDVLKAGQKILVQIAKEPISTKGPRLTSEISIAGRNLVLIPFSNKVSVSQKIKSVEERNRLINLIKSIKPSKYGVIIRTVAEGKRVADFDAELRELVEKWEGAFMRITEQTKVPSLAIGELNRTSAIVRDMMDETFNNIVVNDETIYNDIKGYIYSIAPEKEKIVKLHKDKSPIFDFYGIEKQIKGLFGKTVVFKHGAYLVIEHTEALHVIDVNSGNRNKKDVDQETNALEVNLAAADEIARQLRLRDMGGIIVVDFIDMVTPENRKRLYERMKENLKSDRAKNHLLPLSKFGLMEITRQRVRPEMNIKTIETCPVCKGTGEIEAAILFIDELETHFKYLAENINAKHLILKVHPFIGAFLTKGWFKSIRRQWVKKYKRKLNIEMVTKYHFMEFHFFDDKNEKIVL
ncbi:MAG: Rne/Rng family ribonuclease [Bacteroidales bacterium]|nr:Rne/Rng family ribonuclease [Bacteroidales bacterium]